MLSLRSIILQLELRCMKNGGMRDLEIIGDMQIRVSIGVDSSAL